MTKEQIKICEKNKYDIKAVEAYLEFMSIEENLKNFDESLKYFSDVYKGYFCDNIDFAKKMAEKITNADILYTKWPIYCIDWEFASEELMVNYTEVNGFYFKN